MSSAFDAKQSATYDDRVQWMVPGYHIMHQVTDICLGAELPAKARVLMVGVGTGAEVVLSGKNHPEWEITAVEPAAEMAKIGREKIKAAGIANRVQWYDQALKKLDVEEPFDAATLMLVLHFLPDDGGKSALLSHIADRLKPGAPLVVAAFAGDPETTRTKKMYELCRSWAVAHGITPEDAADRINLDRKDIFLVPEERIKALFREAGFIDVQRIYQALAVSAWIARTNR